MRGAADNEDASVKHVAMENRLYPMRELLGELLLQQGQAPAALREFEAAHQGEPEPLPRALRCRARRPRWPAIGRRPSGYYEKLVALASKADTARPEIARAKAFIGAR